jgi:thiosulfate dehydrogenase [quinone] large subunit
LRIVSAEGHDEIWPPGGYASLGGQGASQARRRFRTERRADAGVAANARLTASNAVVLLVLLAAEGVTILRVRQLLSPHVFVFAWTPLLLAGAGSVLSLDAAIAARAPRSGTAGPDVIRREAVLRATVTAAVAAVSLAVGGLAAGLGRLAGGTSGNSEGASLPPGTGPSRSATATPGRSAAKPGRAPSGTAIGPARDVPVGQAASFRDPATGDPSLVIRPRPGTFLAFDAVCPHAGCTVGYDPAAKVIMCPCHGSQFNARTGAVEVGPATSGLKRLAIAEGPDGQLYVS